jgi:hypothetical protein
MITQFWYFIARFLFLLTEKNKASNRVYGVLSVLCKYLPVFF